MPVYQGSDSCYARREGLYVKRLRRKGIDTVREAAAILRLILRDYRRGWTYEQGSCRKIRMTRGLFEKRVRFVAALAKLHGASREVREAVDRLVEYVLKHRQLPARIKVGDHTVSVKRLLRDAYVRTEKPKG